MERDPDQPGVLRATIWPATIRPFIGGVLGHVLHRPSRTQIRASVADASLPEPLSSVVLDVLRRARLWRREQLDVARELAGHFADGLAAGATPEALLASFGNPAAAAKLIRRAKRRARPLWWQSWRLTLRGAGVLVLAAIGLYAVLAFRYFGSRPTIARDYVGEMNAAILATPESQRAWPVYRQAIIALEPLPESLNDRWPIESISDARWPEGLAYLDRNREAIELTHVAATKASLGAPVGGDSADTVSRERSRRHAPTQPEPQSPPAPYTPDPSLFGTPQPFLNYSRELARMLRADLTAAMASTDAARAERDLRTLLHLAAHTREPRFLIAVLTGHAVDAVAFEAIKAVMASSPELLSAAQLRDLAHALAAIDEPADELGESLRVERTGFLDFVQRLYTDNGRGDGHITADGMARLNALIYPNGIAPNSELDQAIMPLAMGAALGRRELTALYDDMLRRGLDEIRTPIWERTYELSSLAYLESTTRGLYNKARNWPAHMLVPAFGHLARSANVQRAQRDAAMIALALELFRRENSRVATSLAELAPRFLPTVPTDPFDGHPLRYIVVNGQPLLYSVGTDGMDDAGTPNKTANTAASVLPPVPPHPATSPAHQSWIQQVGGDWILYPTPARPKPPGRAD